MANIESSRKVLTLLENIVLYMTVNATKLTKEVSNVYASWETFFSDVAVKEKTKWVNIFIEMLKEFIVKSRVNH